MSANLKEDGARAETLSMRRGVSFEARESLDTRQIDAVESMAESDRRLVDVAPVELGFSLSQPQATGVSKPIDRAILRTFLLAAGISGVSLVVLGAILGSQLTVLRGVGPLTMAALAAWRLKRDRSSAPLFVYALVVVVVQVGAQQSLSALTNGSFAVIGLALAATLVGRNRRVPLLAAGAGLLFLAVARTRAIDEPVADTLLAVLVPMAVTFFGSQLIVWAKQEISGRERRFENLFDHVPVAIWEEDFSEVARWLDGLRARGLQDLRGYLSVNPSAIRYGASLIKVTDINDEAMRFVEAPGRESLLGRLDADTLIEESLDAISEELVAVWEGRSSLRIDLVGRTQLGNPIDGFLLMSAPTLASGIDWSKVVVAMVDVREQRETQRQLEELVDSKDQFVASVSHELRTPLAAVIGLAHELKLDPAGFSEDERNELVSVIADQATDVGNIVEDLLVAARADIGKVSIHPEPVHLGSEVRATVSTVDPDGLYEVDLDSGAIVQADPRRLRQILRNLVSNARRYGGDTVSINVSTRDGLVHLEVCDDGDGIPDGLRDRIFDPYATAHEAKGVTGSVGLGLTVSRQLARLMGGNLTYDHVDDWTVFRLTLPAA